MFKVKSYTATLAVSDIDRAKEFYTTQLGCDIINEDDNGVALGLPGSGEMLAIYPSSFAGSNQATAVSFRVDDVAEAVAALKATGITMEEYDFPGLKTENGVATLPDGQHVGWFKDPDGNILAVGDNNWAE